jgi:hypothetical protein
MATFEETKRHNQVGEKHQDAVLGETSTHNRAVEENAKEMVGVHRQQVGIAGGHLSVAQQGLALQREKFESDLKNDPTRHLPEAVKLAVKGQERTVAGIEATLNKAMLDPTADPAGLSKLRAQLANAQQKMDDLIAPHLPKVAGAVPAAGADPMGYNKPKGAPGAPSAAAAPALTMPQRAPAPAVAPPAAPPVDPMAAKLAAESSALNRGQILDFSPEVKAYIQQKKAAEQQANEAYRQQEQQRALEQSRRLVPR